MKVIRMRPHEHIDLAKLAMAARAERGDPPPYKPYLRTRLGNEARRSGEEYEWSAVGQPGGTAEGLALTRRSLFEPLVEQLCPGRRYLVDRQVVIFMGLASLCLVPDDDEIRFDAQQPLIGQVVPACDADARPDPALARCLYPIDLIGCGRHER